MASLLVVHPFLPNYRRPFFDRLDATLSEMGWRFGVVDSDAPPSISGRGDKSAGSWVVPARTRWFQIGERAVAYREIGPPLASRAANLVIVEQAIKNLETYPLLARQHLGGPSVAMWGHGRSYSTPQGPKAAALKQFLTRRSQWFFAYTQAGADHVVAHGFPRTRVSVLNNTIDTAALQEQLAEVTDDNVAAFQRQHRLTPGRTALFLGGVDKAKGIDFLLESARCAAEQLPGFVLLIGGAGEDLPKVQAAQAAGGPIRALGRLDGAAKALALQACDVMAIPNWIGLVAVDSLASGRPIITRDNSTHSPEAEYLSSDTSVWLPADVTAAEYARALVDTTASGERLASLQRECLAVASGYSLDHMVDAFVEGVLAWDDLRRAGL